MSPSGQSVLLVFYHYIFVYMLQRNPIQLAIFCEHNQASQLFVFQVLANKISEEEKNANSSIFFSSPSPSLCWELVLSTQKHETDP